MQKLLALDVGKKHTGVAFCDTDIGVPLPLDTIHHETDEELVESLTKLITDRQVDTLVVGLPLMPSGQEGEEVEHVHSVCAPLKHQCAIEYVDERETSRKSGGPESKDPHAHAAVKILTVYLERSGK